MQKYNPLGVYGCSMDDCIYKRRTTITKIIVLTCVCLILGLGSSCTHTSSGRGFYSQGFVDDIVSQSPYNNPVTNRLMSELDQKYQELQKIQTENEFLKRGMSAMIHDAAKGEIYEAALNRVIDFVHSNSDGNVNRDLAKTIVLETFKHSDQPLLMLSIFKSESNYKPDLVNECSGATGIGQVMPSNIRLLRQCGLNVSTQKDLKSLTTGIKAANKMLELHVDEANGDLRKGLYRYVGSSKKTKYVNTVMADRDKLEKLMGIDVAQIKRGL